VLDNGDFREGRFRRRIHRNPQTDAVLEGLIMARVLITGGAGFLGPHLADWV
jgi:hypothetical protein